MEDVHYRSNVAIEIVDGPIRRATIPGNDEPVIFGVHSEVAEHYNVDPDRYPPSSTTLDYVVAAAAG